MNRIQKLILGTANFGIKYGIACQRKLKKEEIFKILDIALKEGFWGVDTAPAYGEAELILGEYIEMRNKKFNIITKLPHKEYSTAHEVEIEVFKSLQRLQVQKIDFLLIHSFETFKKYNNIIIPVLSYLINKDIIKYFGISVYHPEEVMMFLKLYKKKFAVEFPLNLFDRRFLPFLKEWKKIGLFLFGRSIFLQGLFFLQPKDLKGKFLKVKDKLLKLRELSLNYGVDISCIALNFVVSKELLDGFIVGVDSLEHLLKNLECLKNRWKLSDNLFKKFEFTDEEILLPYKW